MQMTHSGLGAGKVHRVQPLRDDQLSSTPQAKIFEAHSRPQHVLS
eukprot:CAMPEP_0119111360 /NCGR_PEP_ID=MMETSP1180-20130426/35252_1 /TAXON_ID=3052 ORGANISM="Chlamydomonas cf sp, Strain CCMP681" /NCGR_SAMPLE_ID=MMETSP1180 /ASSEMBLY_ACC=CAM_ASM_000741 /LENGTH=44 /DNA_ID= /DNA_START= /DNA_END= /DNA_ORIENTATION=